jgi:ABC-type glycerol-3-phosphate transport system substrate-binding protein
MLKTLTILLVVLVAAGGVLEYAVRDKGLFAGTKTLRIGAEGWQIHEFKLHEQVQRFGREHPEVRVELHQLPTGYETNLMLQATAKNMAYDIILSGNNYTLDRYYVRELICPIGALAPQGYDRDIIPGMLRAAQVSVVPNREVFLLPYMGEVEILNYRKDIFEEAGLTRPPETWKEFEEYAEKLQAHFRAKGLEKKLRPMSLNLEQGGFFLQNVYLVLLQSLRGKTTDELGHIDMSSPESRQVFRMLKRWRQKDYVGKSCLSPNSAANDFKSGLTAMFPTWQSRGQWALRNEALKGKVGFAPLPEAKRVGSLICVYGGMVLKDSPAQKEAVQFLSETMCGYGQEAITRAGKMPVTLSSYQKGKLDDWQVEILPTIENGYTAPEPMLFFELTEYISVAFHNYLNSDSDDPSPFLEWAAQQAKVRVYDRQKPVN